ncbi:MULTISPECIES: DUF3558 domain-containing protein [Nocardiopsidaceae]|uniref:DUF3558 domain-containing protein n=1 Tax=Streptomonospora nanhaiensis TaxID=1323731 RepID=A0ABY6YJE9_9ACTN|nr:DUF3558 domain-containing protein [Streptomonospora nanhaiensis]WAE72101.1 DUF3558 domain-containing protein [Streptomonospora nanhaiensis]
MSENGPYNQPPQNPYGGGDNSGGQPPYGAPYGDPGTGGQPAYGAPTGPGQGFPGPEQQMYAGGQPPYGGGPGYPHPQPQPPQGGGRARLWVVIGGGVVIVVLVVAVLVMLVTNGNGGTTVAAPPEGEPSASAEEATGGDEPAPEPDPDAAPAGEPPYSVPTEPCDAFTEQVVADFLVTDGGNKSVRDENSSCDTLDATPPEGNAPGGYASFGIVYQTPYSAADSVEAATSQFQDTVAQITGESEYSTLYDAGDVEESKEVELGDEAHFIVTKYDYVGDLVPEAVLLVRTANLNIQITYQLHPSITGEDSAEDLVLPDNVEEIMVNAGADALAVVGT